MTAKPQANTTQRLGSAWHFATAWLALAAALAPSAGSAQTAETINLEDVYRIEFLVFADDEALARQANATNTDPEQERWAPPSGLAYPKQLVFLRRGSPATTDTANELVNPVSADAASPDDTGHIPPLLATLGQQTSLAETAAALQRRSRYRLLFHNAWNQSLTDRDNAPAIPLTGGQRFDDWFELGGTVTFSKERFLHITTDLWLSEFAYRNEFREQRPWYAQGTAEHNWLPALPSKRSTPNNTRGTGEDNTRYTYDDNEYRVERTYVLREYRRLRRDEIHYLDHPVFGAIVMISKYTSQADGA